MAKQPRLLFYFLHLLGVGHVYRAKRLIEGFAKAGIAVDVIYGGEPIPNIRFEAESVHFLPPIRAGDNAYSFYLDADGQILDSPFQQHRTKILLKIFEGLDPDIILTEAFPFGRRMVRHELKALFDASKKRESPPLMISSVRDILQERKKPGRVEETRDWINDYFDRVLVHSDPKIIRLNETFPLTTEIENKLSYTGFVVPKTKGNASVESFDVIVSAGGGAFGGSLMGCTFTAAKNRPDLRWCIAVGPNSPTEISQELRASAPPHITVVTAVENLAAHMAKAKISISQCGYNTAMDALTAHRESDCRAIFVPYDTEGQSEQLRRAELLASAGYAVSIPQSKLTKPALLSALDKAMNLPSVDHDINFNGVDNSAQIILNLLGTRQ